MMQTYKRLPVTFVMGEGCHLYDAEGRAVPRLPRGHLGAQHRALPSACRGGDPGAGGAPRAGLEPLLQRAGRAAGAAPGGELRAGCARVPLQLRHGGERGDDQAGAKAPARGRDRRAGRRLPRPHDGLAVRDAAARQAGAVRAARAGLRRPCRATTPTRSAAAVDRAHGGRDARAGPGRDRHLADLRAHAAGRARGVRPVRARC